MCIRDRIWVDLVAPSREERKWIADIFGLVLPDIDDLTDLEESARFYICLLYTSRCV